MASPISFVSQTDRRNEREEKRQAQALILQKAKEKHERKEQEKEAHKLRGDDKWMLSSVTDRIQAEGDQLKSKKHKKEKDKSKKKKKKKEKKARRHHKHHESNSDSSSEEDGESNEMEWVENVEATPKTSAHRTVNGAVKRDDWMSNPFNMATFSRDDIRKEKAALEGKTKEEKEKERKSILDNPGQSDRELNPFWKDGGTGVPTETKRNTPIAKVGVSDAGASWLRKQYQRVVERSGEEGRSVEELAAERWGSLDKYHELLAKAEGTQNKHRDPPRKYRDTHGGADQRTDRGGDDRGRGGLRRGEKYTDRDSGRIYERSSDTHKRVDRTQGKSRSPERDGDKYSDRYSDKYGDRDLKSSSTSRRYGTDDNQRRDDLKPSVFGSMRGMFRKPGEDLDRSSKDETKRGEESSRTDKTRDNRTPSWKKKPFLKPSEDMKETRDVSSDISTRKVSSSTPAWKKESATKSEEKTERTLESQGRNLERKDKSRSSSESSSESGSESDSSSGPEGGREPSPPPPRNLSEAEKNQLGAKIVKAELMGNEDLAKRLKAQLEASRQGKASQPSRDVGQPGQEKEKRKKDGRSSDEEVVLTRMDRAGQSWPLQEQSGSKPSQEGKKRKKKQNILTHDRDGQRERYFGDDDQQDLKDMVRKERMTSAEDHLKIFNKVANKALKKLTDDHTLDDMFVSTAAQKRPIGEEEERQRAAAIGQHRKMAASMSKCPFCLDSPEMQKHLIIALGIKVYLCLPATQSLTDGHCLIVPMQHTVASTALDEDIWSEIQTFRKGLTKMFEDQERDAMFLETCMNPQGHRHMTIECIPLPKELGDEAPIYFKKAIQESESEWSQNKKLVDTRKKDIRRSVPQGFPYFSVDFGLDGGFAHVIEDEKSFPHYFGKEIIGGMLDLEPRLWRRPHRQNFDDQRRKVLQFGDWWKPFDWTQRIGKE